ncbi:MAG TPA: UMP kinase [Candidatus Hydrogenedens sp.]|nr:UMP kinase [Candidatus Hydrogenedens sp.]HOK09830.1 UMP kinase [Candidatus Hydrogenedens sp.]HOL19487.1 UMP kinase [Candidatus Hydrogenedens sp.]HPP59409.1 UMP kinase [Candidatus Hydrogenedens sp.]
MSTPIYKRVLLKLSGNALSSDGETIGSNALNHLCDEIVSAYQVGVQMGLVVGGGNILRGNQWSKASGVDRATADYMGMLATVINALALQSALEKRGIETRVLSAIEMRPVAEPYIRRRALRHLEKGRIVIFAAGTGNPFLTTDTAAALRASEIDADILMKATRVDGVYSSDPEQDSSAKRFDQMNYQEVLTQNLKVMDAAAISICREKNIPILVFSFLEKNCILNAVYGHSIGTIVKGD